MLTSKVNFILWFCLFFLLVNLYVAVKYKFEFINHSLVTSATVLSVEKKIIGYNVTVKFLTSNDTLITTKTSTLSKLVLNELVDVKYNPSMPSTITRDTILETWLGVFFILSAIIVIGIILFLINVFTSWKKKRAKKLRQEGNYIYTTFKTVEAVLKIEENGRHPYQIISSWYNQKNKKEYIFKSKYLWVNPTEYIIDQTISVLIDSKNIKKYVMDVSFLPETIR